MWATLMHVSLLPMTILKVLLGDLHQKVVGIQHFAPRIHSVDYVVSQL